ncbi:uncharacterized protein LOC115429718 [Sphaeramia orbicularis]|uniref:uncharacterized protein LOC115429718 n=1 Tax=Sphaeramia orbicularis TaxID=375764 RepID=UPI0011809801|nr:uncharacterized protein LOC115429718 [Sphaeramia orbicularis]
MMSGLWWMAVMVTMFLSPGNSSAAVDQNLLARTVQDILNMYKPQLPNGQYCMFSLAVSIPYDYTVNLNAVYESDPGDEVKTTILNCDVYTGRRVVAATVLKWPNVLTQCPNGRVQWLDVVEKCRPEQVKTWDDVRRMCPDKVYDGRADHAEYRTLENFNNLVNSHNRNDLLLFYVHASSCPLKCIFGNERVNILDRINPIRNWSNYAFVFSQVFKPRFGEPIPEEKLRQALLHLGTYSGRRGPIGLDNIFLCDKVQGRMQCTCCSSGGEVTPLCYRYRKTQQ